MLTESVTLRQYEDMQARAYCQENGLSLAYYWREQPRGMFLHDWSREMLEFCANGGVIKASTLDAIIRASNGDELSIYHFRHDYPRSIPDGYILPSARKRSAENKIKYGHLVRKNKRA